MTTLETPTPKPATSNWDEASTLLNAPVEIENKLLELLATHKDGAKIKEEMLAAMLAKQNEVLANINAARVEEEHQQLLANFRKICSDLHGDVTRTILSTLEELDAKYKANPIYAENYQHIASVLTQLAEDINEHCIPQDKSECVCDTNSCQPPAMNTTPTAEETAVLAAKLRTLLDDNAWVKAAELISKISNMEIDPAALQLCTTLLNAPVEIENELLELRELFATHKDGAKPTEEKLAAMLAKQDEMLAKQDEMLAKQDEDRVGKYARPVEEAEEELRTIFSMMSTEEECQQLIASFQTICANSDCPDDFSKVVLSTLAKISEEHKANPVYAEDSQCAADVLAQLAQFVQIWEKPAELSEKQEDKTVRLGEGRRALREDKTVSPGEPGYHMTAAAVNATL